MLVTTLGQAKEKTTFYVKSGTSATFIKLSLNNQEHVERVTILHNKGCIAIVLNLTEPL